MRKMIPPPSEVQVFRNKKWDKVLGNTLVPGDIVFVKRDGASPRYTCHIRSRLTFRPLSCDMLILSGSAIVNEAMLTGESTPLQKESIATRGNHAAAQTILT